MVCLLICLLFAMAECQKSLSPDGTCGVVELLDTRVVGGGNISAEYAPWNVILERAAEATPEKIVSYCGGNIITPNFVLTTAHCIWGERVKIRNPEELNVYVGRSSIRLKNKAISIKRIILHEKWYKTVPLRENIKLGHDIALLQLEKELVFSDTIQPICLSNPNNAISMGTSVTINGYGLIRKNPKITAEHLQTGDMEIRDKTACISSWSGRIEGDQLCALGVDSCKGDSGSGLTVYVNQPRLRRSSIAVLVGLTSFGPQTCENPSLPGVYTNVLSHVGWIEKKIQNLSIENELLKYLGLEVIPDDRLLLPTEIKNGLTTIVKDFITFYPDISIVFPEKCKFFLSQPSDFRSLLSMYKNGDLILSQINLINLETKCEADDVNDMSDLLLKVNDVWFHSDQDVEMWRNLAVGAASGNSAINRVYLSSSLTAEEENIDYIVDVCLYTPHFEINDVYMEPKHWKKLSNKLQTTSNKTAEYMGLGYNRRENFAHVSEVVLSVESVGLWNNFADTQHHWELFLKAAEERRKAETQALKTIWIYEAYARGIPSVEIKVKAKKFGIDLKTECKYWYKDC